MKCDFNYITVEDLKKLLKLAHELYDLRSHPEIFKRCLLARLRRLYSAKIALCAVVVPVDAEQWRYANLSSAGWTSRRQRDRFHGAFSAPVKDNPLHRLLHSADHLPLSHSIARGGAISEADWRESGFHANILAPAGLFDCVYSRVPLAGPRFSLLALFRSAKDPHPFSRRESVGLHALHEEIARLTVRQSPAFPASTSSASSTSSAESWLSPRLHQTLQLLLDGVGEKQVAHSLGLSQHTVHCHIRNLYRRFKVNSRAELLSRFVSN